MTEIEQIESSQRQYHNEIQHQMKVGLLEIEQQYKRFAMLNPRVYKDGDKMCVGFGEMPEGVFGFGDTIHQAVVDWENEWNKPLSPNVGIENLLITP